MSPDQDSAKSGKSANSLLWPAAAICLLVIVLAYIAPDLPLWSLDSWSYLTITQILGVLAVSAAITYLAASSLNLIESLGNRSARIALGLAFSVGLALVLHWLSSATYIYGDGYVRTAEIVEKGKWLRFTEPLDTVIRQLTYQITHAIWGWSGETASRLIAILCGVAYFWIGLWGSRFISDKLRDRALVVALLWASGLTALFFGYVETYPTSVVACLVLLLASVGVLKERFSLRWLIAIFIIAVLLHTSMLCFAPALLYVLAIRLNRRWGAAVMVTLALVAGLGLLIYLVSIFELKGGYSVGFLEFVLIPLTPGASYWIFARDHLTDIVNEYLLVAPAAVASIALLLPVLRSDLQNKVLRFLLLATLLGFGFALLFNTHLGFARDWDLFAFIGLPAALLASFLWINRPGTRVAAWLLIWLGFSIGGMYVVLLASEEPAVARFQAITDRYEHGRAYNYETLSIYYYSNNQLRSAIGALEKASAASVNARYPHSIGALYLQLSQPNKAIPALMRSLAIDSSYVKDYPLLVDAYTRLRDYDSAMTYLQLAVDHLPGGASAEDFFQVGIWLHGRDSLAQATHYFTKALDRCDSTVAVQPDDYKSYLLAARIELELADTTAAREWLTRLLAEQPPADIRLQANSLRSQMRSGE